MVFNPAHLVKQEELFEQSLNRNIDVILDPKSQELATLGGHTPKLASLSWAEQRPHNQEDFLGAKGNRIVKVISDFAQEKGFTQLIAPTHILASADDKWLDIDIAITNRLRNQLDKSEGSHIPLIYSLTIPYAVFRNQEQRQKIINALKFSFAEMVWLKIDGLGSNNTANKTCNYIKAASDFHELGKPVIADHIGGLPALALLCLE